MREKKILGTVSESRGDGLGVMEEEDEQQEQKDDTSSFLAQTY